MSTPSAKLGNAPETPDDGDKLLDLYKNRAELKKEFAALRDEKFQLQERIKEHQGATARVQQQLEHLENLLQDPEWMYSIIVAYQLRALNSKGKRKLAAFAEELKQQREQRRHGQSVVLWNKEQSAKLSTIKNRLGEHRAHLEALEEELRTRKGHPKSSGPLSGIFGRSGSSSGDKLTASIDAAKKQEQQLLQDLQKIQSSPVPDQPGLDVAAKRSINFMILSFAQQLWLQLSTDDFASLAKEAADKSPGAFKYGTKDECELLLKRIRNRMESFDKVTAGADVLQRRAQLIADSAMFHGNEDTVADTGTVATVYAIDADGIVKKTDCNLLGLNYWGLANLLTR